MRKTILLCLVALAVSSFAAPSEKEVLEIIKKVNSTWQTSHAEPGNAFWDNAVYHTGNMEVVKLLSCYGRCGKKEAGQEPDETCLAGAPIPQEVSTFLAYSMKWAEQNRWMGATEPDNSKWLYKKYGEKPQYVLFGDWQICFQTYIDLYKAGGQKHPEMVARAKEVMGYEARSKENDFWWWADALYMVMPVMTKMYLLTGEEQYLQKMYDNWQYANSLMYDKETGLYFRDAKYVYPKHKTAQGKKDFWARGDGWVMAAFAKVLSDMDLAIAKGMKVNKKQKGEIERYYKRMAKAIVALQQDGGYWTRSMMDPEQAPGYETSGTALICYSLLWGINNGYLPKKYAKAAEQAWNYLYTIALQPDYTIGYVQPIGEKAIPGQVVDKNSVSNFGTGAFLLAACEYLRTLNIED